MLQSRTSAASSLQRIYEEGYLKCSTAVYYEGQGNEEEAMRCWKAAVEEIRQQCSETVIPDYTALSETEKSLANSLRELEFQAQERVDLLRALKQSRQDDTRLQPDSFGGTGNASGSVSRPSSAAALGNGWIGGGTIPAVTYGELSRPVPPTPSHRPPPPPQPVLPDIDSPSRSAVRTNGSGRTVLEPPSDPFKDPDSDVSPSQRIPLHKMSSRSPVREKQHVLRPTLRTGNSSDSHQRSSRSSTSRPASERLGASKAATLAWNALGFSSGKAESARKSPDQPSSSQVQGRRSREDSPSSRNVPMQWDSNSRRLVPKSSITESESVPPSRNSFDSTVAVIDSRRSGEYAALHQPSPLSLNAAASALSRSLQTNGDSPRPRHSSPNQRAMAAASASVSSLERRDSATNLDQTPGGHGKQKLANISRASPAPTTRIELRRNTHSSTSVSNLAMPPLSAAERSTSTATHVVHQRRIRTKKSSGSNTDSRTRGANEVSHLLADVQLDPSSSEDSEKLEDGGTLDKDGEGGNAASWKGRKQSILKHLPPGVDEEAAKQILNEIVVHGDVVHWNDIAGLEPAKKALREAVVYPFLRPDLFMGLREPATGMLLFGPPGTGKTMLARAVATESKSTFFSISASSLTSKYLGESEKLVRALFGLAKTLAPSIIFVDEIDSILSQRSGSGEHEATRRIKTEFLIQWSDLQRAAAGREEKEANRNGDASRVLVLAATNLPWAIDEAARRRFVRRQYIPLPEAETRTVQLQTLLGQQKHNLSDGDIDRLVGLTEGFSGSDITALAKDAAMGPLRSLGEALLMMKMDEIRPMELSDFLASLQTIRPSVSKSGLKEYEDWAREFGERGG